MIQAPWKRKREIIWYKNMTPEEKRVYHREKMKQTRDSKREYYLRVMRWLPWRYIDESRLFNENDLLYIKSLWELK